MELLKAYPDNVMAVSVHGEVTRKDYDTVLVPAVEQAIQAHEKARLLHETAPDFAGYTAGAAWEDLKVGLEHSRAGSASP